MGINPLTRGPAVFVDRDGVINVAVIKNGRPFPPASLDEVRVLPGVPDALRRLKTAGFAVVVVTNQPDVARGTQTREVVESIHAVLAHSLAIDEFRVCFHDDADDCDCRKPRPGLLTRPPHYDLGASVMIGDRWRDVAAGRNAGVRATILIDSGHTEPCPVEPTHRSESLAGAADWILSGSVPSDSSSRGPSG